MSCLASRGKNFICCCFFFFFFFFFFGGGGGGGGVGGGGGWCVKFPSNGQVNKFPVKFSRINCIDALRPSRQIFSEDVCPSQNSIEQRIR